MGKRPRPSPWPSVQDLQTADRAWISDAACARHPRLPWTSDADHANASEQLVMTAVCRGCPVQSACAAYADRAGVVGGFWAGRYYDHPEQPEQAQLPPFIYPESPGAGGDAA